MDFAIFGTMASSLRKSVAIALLRWIDASDCDCNFNTFWALISWWEFFLTNVGGKFAIINPHYFGQYLHDFFRGGKVRILGAWENLVLKICGWQKTVLVPNNIARIFLDCSAKGQVHHIFVASPNTCWFPNQITKTKNIWLESAMPQCN